MAVWSFMTQDCLNMGFIGYSLEKNALYILQHDAEFKKKPQFFPFSKFGQHNTHILHCSLHAMFSICLSFSDLTTKRRVYATCTWASKQPHDSKNST